MSHYETIVLELDAILVDGSDARASAWVHALRGAGHDVSFAAVRERLGMGADRMLFELTGLTASSPLAKRIHAERRHLFRSALPGLSVLAGGRDLLARIRREGHLLVATSSVEDDACVARELLEQAQLLTAFDAVVTLSPGEPSKPAPDALLAALDRTQTRPSQALVLGDTPYDIAAARAAGLASVALRSGGWPDAALAGAIAVYRDALDLLASFEMSPLSRSSPSEASWPAPDSVAQAS